MKCEEMLAALNAYVDGDTASAVCHEFQEHLGNCHPCQLVVDSIRRTITLYRDGKPVDLPPALHQRLCGLLRAKWDELHGGCAGSATSA